MRGYFTHGPVTTHYEYLPNPGKPVLALSNSLGTDMSMWSSQLSELSEQVAILRYDTRGHGASSCPPGPYSIGDLGKDILSLMDHLEIKCAHVCGLSMGGMIAQWLGIHAPGRVRSLLLANTAAKIGTIEGWNERIHTVLHDGMSPIVPAVLQRWYTPQFLATNHPIADQTASMLLNTNSIGYAACCGAIREMDLRDKLQSIHAPTLVIYGVHDSVTTSSDAAFLCQGIEKSECVALEARHLSNIEAAHAFTEAVSGFLDKTIEADNDRP
jgi:3-oxoadipate enol-lactonase